MNGASATACSTPRLHSWGRNSMLTHRIPFIAVDANLPAFGQVKARTVWGRAGGNYNEWGFSNRMLDTTVAFMGAK